MSEGWFNVMCDSVFWGLVVVLVFIVYLGGVLWILYWVEVVMLLGIFDLVFVELVLMLEVVVFLIEEEILELEEIELEF